MPRKVTASQSTTEKTSRPPVRRDPAVHSGSSPEPGRLGACPALAWEVLSTRTIYSAPPWVTLSLQQVCLPDGRVILDYHRLQLPEYCVVFAETIEGRVIVERQYKHGVGAVTLMLPAGLIEPGEAPLKAAQRELLEETGYQAADWQLLGSFVPNSNYGCGKAHLYLARQARRIAEPDAGDLEEMEILLLARDELFAAVRGGQIHATSVVAAIALATHPQLTPATANASSHG
jgi:ADP-ribose pyrophosphatase